MNGVVLCEAKVEHPKMIGNHCMRAHGGGVVFRNISGVVFGLSNCMRLRTMKRGVWHAGTMYVSHV